MKRFLSIMLAIALSLGTLPLGAFAAVDPKSQEFQNYLTEIGMTESEFVTYLKDVQEATLNDFDNLEELKYILGPLVDDQNLQEMLTDLEITEEELNKLLEENGKTLDQYSFIGDLYFDVTNWLYPETQTPITDENLKILLEDFGFASKKELESFLKEYDDSIKNYQFIEELESAVAGYYLAQAEEELMAAMDSLGLTMEETERLANYFVSLMEDPNFNEETFMVSLENISNRLMNFADFDSASDLTPEQIAEFIAIWDDLLNLLNLKVEYYLLKDGKETPISFATLIQMDDIGGADLLIKIYTKSGEFLVDMIITKEMFGSDFVEETGKNLKDTKKAAEEVKKAVDKVPATAPAKTVNGGKLPNTASDYLQNTMAGLVIVLLGALVFRKVKTRRA
ncbi:processed acidic surface protein [Mesobacillus subterraneus]|uniref:Processed acidic surface protein n=1 Tax=Mesobacillus subterraneus TaxID=285983 RepID=A0A427TRH8_9BACI|nr:processed acidic surface protein [Mesobacillus subterraneus]RSD27012.1 processed acidic surface protein [Mesobacillus subterraneus]